MSGNEGVNRGRTWRVGAALVVTACICGLSASGAKLGFMSFAPASGAAASVQFVAGPPSQIPPLARNFVAPADGSQEVPPADTRARGQSTFQLSADGTELSFKVNVANLHNITMAHIHVGAEGVNGSVVAWLYPDGPPAALIPGRTSGVLAQGVITADDLVGPLTGEPLSALVELMMDEGVYVNVHTSQYPGGEIRGQIRPAGRR